MISAARLYFDSFFQFNIYKLLYFQDDTLCTIMLQFLFYKFYKYTFIVQFNFWFFIE